MIYLFIYTVLVSLYICGFQPQSFTEKFDKIFYDYGYIYITSVQNALHWGAAPQLDKCFNLFLATKYINSLNKLIIHIIRIQERRDDNIRYAAFMCDGSPLSLKLN
jgi:hypothetical protein